MSTNGNLPLEEKALRLLAGGVSQEQVAAALGVTDGRISQLVSDADFAAALQERRFQNLQAATNRDKEYDSLEDDLIAKMKKQIPLLQSPLETVRVLAAVNAAKRRGMNASDVTAQQAATVVNILMPTKLVNKFVTNINNQVVSVQDIPLLTIQSGQMEKLLASASQSVLPSLPNTSNIQDRNYDQTTGNETAPASASG